MIDRFFSFQEQFDAVVFPFFNTFIVLFSVSVSATEQETTIYTLRKIDARAIVHIALTSILLLPHLKSPSLQTMGRLIGFHQLAQEGRRAVREKTRFLIFHQRSLLSLCASHFYLIVALPSQFTRSSRTYLRLHQHFVSFPTSPLTTVTPLFSHS